MAILVDKLVGWVKRSADPTRVRASGPMLALGLTAAATAGSALAQPTTTPGERLAQAFRTYCIETRAEPNLVRAEVEKARSLIPKGVATFTRGGSSDRWPGGGYDTAQISDSIDSHDRLTVGFGGPYGASGRRCHVEAPWGEIQELLAALAAIGIGNGTSAVVREGLLHQAGTELRRWTIRVGEREAVVELRVLSSKGIPGRSVTLLVAP